MIDEQMEQHIRTVKYARQAKDDAERQFEAVKAQLPQLEEAAKQAAQRYEVELAAMAEYIGSL